MPENTKSREENAEKTFDKLQGGRQNNCNEIPEWQGGREAIAKDDVCGLYGMQARKVDRHDNLISKV